MLRRFLWMGVFFATLALPVSAQQAVPNGVIVNGTSLPASTVIGSTGDDMAVAVTPVLRASGAQVRNNNGHLDALWGDNCNLQLQVGSNNYTYKGKTRILTTPCGALGDDLVMPLRQLCGIIEARVETLPDGNLAVYRDVVAATEQSPVPPRVPIYNAANYGPDAATGQSFPEAGRGGLTSKVENVNTPYDRPQVSVANVGITSYTLETPRTTDAIQASSAAPGGSPGTYSSGGASAYNSGGYPGNSGYNNGGYSGGAPSNGGGYGGGSPYGSGANMGNSGISAGGSSPMGRVAVDQFGLPVGMSGGMSAGSYTPSGASSGMQGGGSSNPGPMQLALPSFMGKNHTMVIPSIFGASGAMGSTADSAQRRDEGIRYIDSPQNVNYQPTPRRDQNGREIALLPAKIEISEFDVQRMMSFHITAYEVRAKVKNSGQLACNKPFVLKLLAKSSRYSNYELLESYLINPLAPGAEVEVVKKVDGHQFTCLVDTRVDFKVAVLEEQIPKVQYGGASRVYVDKRARKRRQAQNPDGAAQNGSPSAQVGNYGASSGMSGGQAVPQFGNNAVPGNVYSPQNASQNSARRVGRPVYAETASKTKNMRY